MEYIQEFFQQVTRMKWSDYLDIIIVAFLLYRLLPLIRTTGATKVAKAVVAIIVVAVKMALPSLAELLETALPPEVEEEIVSIASAVEGVRDVHELKTRRNGMSYIIDAHIVVSPDISIVEAHEIATAVEEALCARYGRETQLSIHVEPCVEAR